MSRKSLGKNDNIVSESIARLGINYASPNVAAVFLVATAGIAHLSLIPEHGDVLILAAFFAGVGILQLALGGLFLFFSSKWLYRIGILSSVGLIPLYFATRFVGIPIGHYNEPEPVDALGLLVKAAELGFMVILLHLSRAGNLANGGRGGRIAMATSKSDTAPLKPASLILVGLLLGASFGIIVGLSIGQPQFTQLLPRAPVAMGQNIREYTLIVEPKQMKVGDKTWEVWTYNGTVPAPTLRGKVGEILRVKVINKHNMTHSFHTHLSGYKFEMDGSQANIIAGKGVGSMIPPNREYVYEFQLRTAGIFYFHCHSADGGRSISQHIRMGLYGAIIVDEPDISPAKDFVLFYGEGQPGSPAPFVINNRGIPGGEMALMEAFEKGGFDAVAAQLNVTVTAFKVKKDDVVRLHIINIGDLYHSHHHHGFEHRSIRTLRGDSWAASVLPLMPGQADTLEFRAIESGIWLIHCHVVSHADAGMIAVLIVE
ncbi:MAG: multicopper oxidase domain-containing protein [Thaumarchaeota archaeon]|nr:multicopper oxidase domain-containing protein [Nitrososphaerota archaeon]